ncbi:hypothetical protein PIB30_028567 [Stylosanthes scabra]|uniref:FAR1 domain-containing protein n=1 Tax=Stylosanthes scabra TaxID=79078 RepID=A0ABU6UBC7_9FABA|nr:hypothetical protein [Stylosanthes scabra]
MSLKVGMTFKPCIEANEFHKEYAKRAGFASKIRNSQRNKETGAIKNQFFTCNRERKRTFDIPEVEKTNSMPQKSIMAVFSSVKRADGPNTSRPVPSDESKFEKRVGPYFKRAKEVLTRLDSSELTS